MTRIQCSLGSVSDGNCLKMLVNIWKSEYCQVVVVMVVVVVVVLSFSIDLREKFNASCRVSLSEAACEGGSEA